MGWISGRSCNNPDLIAVSLRKVARRKSALCRADRQSRVRELGELAHPSRMVGSQARPGRPPMFNASKCRTGECRPPFPGEPMTTKASCSPIRARLKTRNGVRLHKLCSLTASVRPACNDARSMNRTSRASQVALDISRSAHASRVKRWISGNTRLYCSAVMLLRPLLAILQGRPLHVLP